MYDWTEKFSELMLSLHIRKGSCWALHYMVKRKKPVVLQLFMNQPEAEKLQGSHQKLLIDSSKDRVTLSWLKGRR